MWMEVDCVNACLQKYGLTFQLKHVIVNDHVAIRNARPYENRLYLALSKTELECSDNVHRIVLRPSSSVQKCDLLSLLNTSSSL